MNIFSRLFRREPPNVPELLARQAVGRLTDLLQHEDRTTRLQAAAALGRLKASSSVEPLRDLLAGNDPELREAAAAALVAIGPAAIAPLAAVVSAKYGAYEPKVAAARALGLIGDPGAVAPLLVAMNDMTANVRSAAADALVLLGAPAVPGLLSLLQDRSNGKRDEIMEPLAKIGDPRAIAALLEALTESPESEWRVRVKAIEALEAFREVPIAPFVKLLLDPNQTIRDAAARRLDQADPGWKRSPAIEAVVAAALQQVRASDMESRRIAVGFLGRLERREFAGLLIKALEDPEVSLREQACDTLGSWREPSAIEPLLGRLMDDNDWVCLAAGKALEAIDPAWRTADSGRRARDQLLQRFSDAKPDVRTAALRGIAEFKDPATVASISEMLTDSNSYVRDQAVHTLKAIGGTEAVQHIIGALRDSDSLIRSTAARCLGELAAPEALEPLQHALKGDDSPSAEKIWKTLRALGWKPAPQPGMPASISGLIFRELKNADDKPADPEAYYLNIAGRVYGGFFPPIDQWRIVGVTAIPENVRLGSLLYKKLVVEGKMDFLGVQIAHYEGRGPDFRKIIGLFFSMEKGTQAEQEAVQPAEPAASGNPTCPQCRTVYNRREVIRQLRQANPDLFDFAIWSAKFRCVKCGEVLTISGKSPE